MSSRTVRSAPRIAAALAAAVLAVTLAGCAGSTGGTAAASPPAPSQTTAAASTVSLATATTSLGTVLVDGKGMTLYMFDKDMQNATASACSGQCATTWPALEVPAGETPQLKGVTGTVGTITGVDGKPQVTLNGWPLYHFAKDAAAGDVNGQGVNGIWWVLSPSGQRMAG